MALNIPVGYAQVTYLYDRVMTPSGAAVTLGLQNDSDLSLEAIADAAQIAFNSTLNTFFDAGAGGTQIRVKKGPTATGPSGDFARAFGGTATGEGVSPAVSLLVRKVTGLGGRQGSGRNYWPGLGESQVNEAGAIDPGSLAAYQGRFDDFFDAWVLAGLLPTLFHDDSGPITTPTPILSFQVQSPAATQRRRQRR